MGKATFDAPRVNAFRFDPEDLELVVDHHDSLYDSRVELPVDEALVLNIMACGVITPVVVTKRDDHAVVVDGRQRVKAAREANRRLRERGLEPVLVTAVTRVGEEADLFGMLIASNEHRQDDSVLGRARKCARFITMGRSEKDAANRFGVGTQTIRLWLEMLSGCTPDVLAEVEAGRLSASAAIQMSKLSRDRQDAMMQEARAAVPGTITVVAEIEEVEGGETGAGDETNKEQTAQETVVDPRAEATTPSVSQSPKKQRKPAAERKVAGRPTGPRPLVTAAAVRAATKPASVPKGLRAVVEIRARAEDASYSDDYRLALHWALGEEV
jgi:ParB family chromosome partitioning protein